MYKKIVFFTVALILSASFDVQSMNKGKAVGVAAVTPTPSAPAKGAKTDKSKIDMDSRLASFQSVIDQWRNPSNDQVISMLNRLDELKAEADQKGSTRVSSLVDRLKQRIMDKHGVVVGTGGYVVQGAGANGLPN